MGQEIREMNEGVNLRGGRFALRPSEFHKLRGLNLVEHLGFQEGPLASKLERVEVHPLYVLAGFVLGLHGWWYLKHIHHSRWVSILVGLLYNQIPFL